jgi:hypothetical protein
LVKQRHQRRYRQKPLRAGGTLSGVSWKERTNLRSEADSTSFDYGRMNALTPHEVEQKLEQESG